MMILPEEYYNNVSEFIKENFGLHFPLERQQDLERELTNICPALGIKDLEALATLIIAKELQKPQLEIIANALTIGETYFLREKKVFEILEHNVIPSIIESKKSSSKLLTIWSAGCSTGEEVYSLAMILESLSSKLSEWQLKIVGTDINTNSLRKAEKGIYSQWSFRTTPSYIKDKYFTMTDDNNYKISSRLRKNIRFQYLNLADDNSYTSFIPGSVDLLLCRNVLMYFNEEVRNRIIKKFKCIIADNGWLILSSSEISGNLNAHFKSVNFTNAMLYKKELGYQPQKAFSIPTTIPYLDPIINNINYQLTESSLQVKRSEPRNEAILQINVVRIEEDIIKKAEECFDSGSFTEVICLLEKELNDSQKYFYSNELEKAYLILSKTYANLGQIDGAKKWCKEVISINKLNHGAYYLLANILLEEGSKEEAVSALRSAIYIEPKFILAMFTLGNILLKIGKLTEARKQFENALAALSVYLGSELVPESDGLTVSYLQDIIRSITKNNSSQ